jgi:hypothetical protein
MLWFYLLCSTASWQRHEKILGVLHGHVQHSTPMQHMAGEEETHVEEDHVEQNGGCTAGGRLVATTTTDQL